MKKKVCIFCKDQIAFVDYKEVNLLRKFMSDRGKIRARRVSGNCSQHQRDVAVAIKTARELALLPYTQRTTSDRPGGRGAGGGLVAAEVARRLELPGVRGPPSPDAADEAVAELMADIDDLEGRVRRGRGGWPTRMRRRTNEGRATHRHHRRRQTGRHRRRLRRLRPQLPDSGRSGDPGD